MLHLRTLLLHWLCLAFAFVASDIPARAQDTSDSIGVNATAAGTTRYVPGHWGITEAQIRNDGDDTSVRCLTWFEVDPALQFGRDVTMPRESLRRTWVPLLTPQNPQSRRSLELAFGLASPDGDQDDSSAVSVDTRPMIIPSGRPRVVYMSDRETAELHALELFTSARNQIAPGILMFGMESPRLPPVEEAWDIADLVVVAADRLAADSYAQSALLGWVRRGGKLWIPLDLMDPDTVSDLLGDSLQMEFVSRTSLTRFQIEPTQGPEPRNWREVEVERPIDLMRVVVDGATVTHVVDGWPAAFHLPFGRGRVTVTTLGVGGWIVQGSNYVDRSRAPSDKPVDFTPAAASLFSKMTSSTPEEPFSREALDTYVTSRIGYRTPARSTIAWILGLHVVLCPIIARALRRAGKPGWTLWSFPALAVVTAAVLVGVGSASRSSPPGQQTFQFVESENGRSEALISGAMAFYSHQDSEPDLGSMSGAVFLPDRRGMEQARWQMIQNDLTEWRLQNVRFRPGVRTAAFSSRLTTDRPLRVIGRFDSNGFNGELESPFDVVPEDALVADRTQVTLPVQISSDGKIESSGQVLPPGEYLNSSVVNEEQTRRQAIFRELFRTEGRTQLLVTRPQLLFWTNPLDLKSGELNRDPADGGALFSVPIEIQRPEPGSTVRIPPPFMTFRAIPAPRARATPAFFSNPRGTWSEYRDASEISLRFQLPPELLPLAAEQVTMFLKISAPSRDVSVLAGRTENAATVGSYVSPVDVLDIEIDANQIDIDAQGGFAIRIRVGDVESDPGDEETIQDQYWKIDWLQVEFTGRTM